MQSRVLREAASTVDPCSIEDLNSISSSTISTSHEHMITDKVSLLTDVLVPVDDWRSIDNDTMGIVYYVSGCIGRSVSRCNRCSSCKDALVEDRDIDVEDVADYKDGRDCLLQLVDRGGLAAPTQLCLSLCILAYT